MSIQDALVEMVAERKRRQLDEQMRWDMHDSDACMACGAYGEDKRSLFVDCFYDVKGVVPDAFDLNNIGNIGGHERGFYLRVCKSCRAEFLASMRSWWRERVARRGRPMDRDGGDLDRASERNIPLRRNGAIEWLTREEWDALQGGDPS